jgi:hypothetical protein
MEFRVQLVTKHNYWVHVETDSYSKAEKCARYLKRSFKIKDVAWVAIDACLGNVWTCLEEWQPRKKRGEAKHTFVKTFDRDEGRVNHHRNSAYKKVDWSN